MGKGILSLGTGLERGGLSEFRVICECFVRAMLGLASIYVTCKSVSAQRPGIGAGIAMEIIAEGFLTIVQIKIKSNMHVFLL